MNIRITVAAFVLLSLSACATSYQSKGFTGGHSSTQLDENVFTVSFRGNAYTGKERARDFTMLRSAEIAMEHGYSYYVIIDEDAYTSTGSYTTPQSSTTRLDTFTFGNVTSGTAKTYYHGGETYTFSKPQLTNTIVCFKEKPAGVMSYSAKFVVKSIREKYGLEESS